MLKGSKMLVGAGCGGIAFVVLVLIGSFIAGTGPSTDAQAGEIREFFADNRNALLWGALIATIATIPGLWFVGVLTHTVRRATGDWVLPTIMVISLALVAAMAWGANGVMGGLIWSDGLIEAMPDELVLYGWNAGFVLYAASSIGFALFLGAAAWALLDTGIAPAWLGWLGALAAVVGVVGVFSMLGAAGGFLSFLGFLAFLAWIVLAGIVMIAGKMQLPEAPDSGARAPAGGAAPPPRPSPGTEV